MTITTIDENGKVHYWQEVINDEVKVDTRPFTLRIRLTTKERTELQSLAKNAGKTMSEYVRGIIFK